MNKEKFFIAIGPPKTGTSWIYHNLNKHPEVCMPPAKEIRYFWAKEFLNKNNFWTNLFGNHWHYREKRLHLKGKIKEVIRTIIQFKRINLTSLFWHIRFFYGTQNNQWYLNLFNTEKLSGDATPKYCELSEESIKQIHELLPKARIIISLRDPIDREWSRAKMNLLKRHKINDVNKVEQNKVLSHFNFSLEKQSNNYVDLIEKWRKYFGDDQIFIFHYEQLQEEPQKLFNEICNFLNIAPLPLPDISIKRNEGLTQTIPETYKKILININYEFICQYAIKYPNKFSLKWREKYK